MAKIVVAVVSAAVSLNLLASERLFAIDKAGFLGNSNRWALATFSKATLAVCEQEGKFKLPCRFSFVPGIGKDRCREIILSSISTELIKKSAGSQHARQKTLQQITFPLCLNNCRSTRSCLT